MRLALITCVMLAGCALTEDQRRGLEMMGRGLQEAGGGMSGGGNGANSSRPQTYIIDGRVITCTTMNTVTNCR